MFHQIIFQTESLNLHTMWYHDVYTGSIAGVPGSLYTDCSLQKPNMTMENKPFEYD